MDNVAKNIDIQIQTIGWLFNEYQSGRLFVDDSFQRRYVWNNNDKIKLIETILLGFTIPEIYLWETGIDIDTGMVQRSIIDGQQRLRAIVDFINGEYCLKVSALEYNNSQYANLYFSELDEKLKENIYKFKFSVRMINDEIKREQIIQIFNRLNCTSYNLTPQELRNARFNGKFLGLSILIANNSFWGKYSFFKGLRRRRMKDVEFMSNILLYFRQGIDNELTQESLDSAYKIYESEYKEELTDKKMFEKIISELQIMINQTNEAKYFINFLKRTTHLYTIITVIAYLMEKGIYTDIIRDKIIDFINSYNNISTINNPLLSRYQALSLEGTKSKVNRIERFETVLEYINQ